MLPYELAKIITKQQNYIKDNLGKKFNYLFCQTELHSWFDQYGTSQQKFHKPRELNHFKPIKQKIKYTTLRGYLRQLASEKNITDIDGSIFPLEKIHRFRHTHGTELINAGVPQHIVQKRLGHASPEMTSVYAHIHDKTMRKEMEEFWDGRVVNNQGQVIVSENPDLDTTGMQWIKRNMKAQSLPDGFCSLPVTQGCPVQGSPCLSCSHLRTTIEFLDVHKKRLEETEKLIENARANGWNRQIENNVPIAENLRRIIRGLEQQEVVYGDESFLE
ncbi:MAG: tyrosine-type recombinase/integrase [Pleurocapsa sp. CRU_1_2]|nr:tyrosine-type recombinase/integrase [Pleurocapsa sp. CRU_1_2]